MAKCPECGCHYNEPEDEQGEHPCPYCGYDEDMQKQERNRVIADLEEVEDQIQSIRRDLDGMDNDSTDVREARKLTNLARNAIEEARVYLRDMD
jgi:uncharacterized Zn finger protein (UPF0148 family)